LKGNHLKRTILALLLMLGLLAAGCGGGGDTAATTPPAEGEGGSAAPAGPSAPPAPASIPKGSEEMSAPVKFKETPDTPAELKKLLRKRIILVEFYLPGDPVTDDVAKDVAELKKLFKKEVAFLSYDINKAAKSAPASEELKPGYAPYFIIIDKDGYIVFRHSGYIDRLTLQQRIFSTLRR